MAAQRQVKHLLHDGGGRGINFKGSVFSIAVLYLDSVVTERSTTGQVVSTRRSFPHTPPHFLSKILGIELVDALDDSLHELACRCVISMFCDGDDTDPTPPEHRLEGDGVFPLARES